MLQQERHNQIIAKLDLEGQVRVRDLSKDFNVTEDCIRKDLTILEKNGKLKRIHGGATPVSYTHLDVYKRQEYGFELALVVLWCNYVPATWANNMLSHNTMPYEEIDGYIKKVNETFTDLDPLYVISGDTDLNEETSCSYYLKRCV